VARSRTAHLAFLRNLHSALAATAALAVLVATLVSYFVARTVTGPIRALTATMREMATTGVLTQAGPDEPAASPSPWEDEDARLLTGTFHALTGSLERFQREAAQRERLSSLGRLSTVIAHEIRNPLMIIKGSLRSLRRGSAAPEEVASVAADIEGEVTRLNKVVNNVLDYAKPIALTYDAVEIDRLVRDAAQAVVASQAGPPDVVIEGGRRRHRHDRRRSPPAGRDQPRDQRPRRRAGARGGRRAGVRRRRRGADPRAAAGARAGPAARRRPRRDRRRRSRRRHVGRRSGAHVRAVLHHQAPRLGHRSWRSAGTSSTASAAASTSTASPAPAPPSASPCHDSGRPDRRHRMAV
jgi:hypothetical protein